MRNGRKRRPEWAGLGIMKPEDMPQMMNTMLDKMFSGMSTDDRIRFVTTMMPKCLEMVFSEMDTDAKGKLAREMINKMMSIFKEELNTGSK